MKRMLINATQKEEWRVALVDGQHLYDLDIESPGYEQKKANIYKGRIMAILPSLDAAFVEYEEGTKPGFLPLKEVSREYFPANYSFHGRPNIKDVLREGQEVIVQIDKEERGEKGAALTTFISLAGTYLVLMPNNPRAGGISRRIEGEDRVELKEARDSLSVPDGMGLIIRTAGVGKSAEALQWDLASRLMHWEEIKKATESLSAPILIHKESNVIVRAFRDYLHPDIGEILIDSIEVLEQAKEQVSKLGRRDFSSKIKLYTGEVPLFSHYQIESQIQSAFQREVRLPSGGSIVIDSTEALTAIDINSARSTRGGDIEETAFNTNLEAADEIARQLRLRDLGGLIVIDFIDMTPIRHQREVENRLRNAVRQDRARIQIGKISRFGLLEMSRQRLSPSLGESSHHVCPRCKGTGTIRDNESLSLLILRLIEEDSIKDNTSRIHAIVPVSIASYLLNEKRESISAIEKRQNVQITIAADADRQTPNFKIVRNPEDYAFSYMLPKLYEEDTEEEFSATERPSADAPVLSSFALPTPTPLMTPEFTASKPSDKAPGFLSRLVNSVKSLFTDDSTVSDQKPVEESKPAPRNNDRRSNNNRRDRNSPRDNRQQRDGRNNYRNSSDRNSNDRNSGDRNRINQQNTDQASERSNETTRDDSRREPRGDRQRRRYDEKRQDQSKLQPVDAAEPIIEQEDRPQVVKERRQRRPLTQKIRVDQEQTTLKPVKQPETATVANIDANNTSLVVIQQPTHGQIEQHNAEQYSSDQHNSDQHNNSSHNENGIPRRSRRSPRHLRVSGQRRRRYRDERYPTTSPMPLELAVASPELASGKIFIQYPRVNTEQLNRPKSEKNGVAAFQPNDSQPEAFRPNDYQPTQPVAPLPVVVPMTEAVAPQVQAIVEPPAVVEPQVVVRQQDSVEQTAEQTIGVKTAAVTNATATVAIAQQAPAIANETFGLKISADNYFEPNNSQPAVKMASAPMTKAPAPEYTAEVPKQSNWTRSQFDYQVRGSGGHAAKTSASSSPAKPKPVE